MYQLPTSVVVNGRQFHITENGDFRMVLDCFKALTDEQLSEDYRVLASLLIFYNEFDDYQDIVPYKDDLESLVTEMYRFFNIGQEEASGIKTNHSLLDWEQDEQMICAAINKVAGSEVRTVPYMHWWTFLGYYMSVGESVLSTVVGIRNKIVNHKPLEKWEREFKRENPKWFTWKSTNFASVESDALLKELWNKGGGN